jgi:hypothetical protein
MGTAGLKVPTGEVVDFPTNTSDALMSGGAHAIAGAIERSTAKLKAPRCGTTPLLLMAGGAGVKLAPTLDLATRLHDTLLFDGLLALQSSGTGAAAAALLALASACSSAPAASAIRPAGCHDLGNCSLSIW